MLDCAVVAGTSPPASVIVVPVVGVAERTKSFSTASPPWLLTTVLLSAGVGATSVLVIEHVTAAPSLSSTVLLVPHTGSGSRQHHCGTAQA